VSFATELRISQLLTSTFRYGRILSLVKKRDTESGRTRAKLLLEILSCAKRTLYVHELQGMLSMDVANHRIDFTKRRYRQHFKEVCGPLVEVSPGGTIELVHKTVKEYVAVPSLTYYLPVIGISINITLSMSISRLQLAPLPKYVLLTSRLIASDLPSMIKKLLKQ
jgi:hypothetical protein